MQEVEVEMDGEMKAIAPRPWSVDRNSDSKQWKDSCSILDAEGGHVCHLTRGYQADADCPDGTGGPSWDNAELIVEAVNAFVARS
jgi:hypothetical protein